MSTDNESHSAHGIYKFLYQTLTFTITICSIKGQAQPYFHSPYFVMKEQLSKYTHFRSEENGEGRGNATHADKARYGELANIKFVIAGLFAELTLVAPLLIASVL